MFRTIAMAVCVWILAAYFIIHAKKGDWRILWGIVGIVLLIWFGLALLAWVVIWIIYLVKNGLFEDVLNSVSIIVSIAILISWIGTIIYLLLRDIKEKGWFNEWIKYKKEKRKRKKERIASLKWEEKKMYEKERKDWKIIIICLWWPFALLIIIYLISSISVLFE